MPTYNKYEKYEEYENGQPTGVFVKGNLISTGEYSSIEECQGGGSSPSVPNPCGVENVVTYEPSNVALQYSLNVEADQIATGGTLDLGKDTNVRKLQLNGISYQSYNTTITSMDCTRLCTENMTGMENMFAGLQALTNLNISNFVTNNVTTMHSMFWGCSSLPSIGLLSFNTSSVEDMNSMFSGCTYLPSIDLSNFNTSSVTDMNSMFEGCSSLQSLDLSNFNTSNVTSMSQMFQFCSSLTSLDLSKFNTSSVTEIDKMFNNCTSLQSLDLSNFSMQSIDMSSKYNYNLMFYNCQSLNHIKCKQAFKDWCSSNKAEIALDNFDTINWEIVP